MKGDGLYKSQAKLGCLFIEWPIAGGSPRLWSQENPRFPDPDRKTILKGHIQIFISVHYKATKVK